MGVEIRNASGRPRAVQSVRSELRGACIRFLKETPVSDALGDAEQGMTASAAARAAADVNPSSSGALVEQRVQVAAGRALSDSDLGTLAEAVVWLQQNRVVLRKTLHAGTVSKKEQVPSMLLAGCKERWKYQKRVVRPSSAFATLEARRGALERFRSALVGQGDALLR